MSEAIQASADATTDGRPTDEPATVAAVGVVAYVAADLAHHALGHGAACLASGGRINLLSSVFVDCSLRGSRIDLAGPMANLILGLIAVAAVRAVPRPATRARLFCLLLAAFNLLWFGMQLAFSAATRTDDWAWAMHEFHVAEPARLGAIALGGLAYFLAVGALSRAAAPFAATRARAMKIMRVAWIAAGAIACATAALDHDPVSAILRHAAPQSLLVSVGLLFVPAGAARRYVRGNAAGAIAPSPAWIIAAVIMGALSIGFLGPGVSLGS